MQCFHWQTVQFKHAFHLQDDYSYCEAAMTASQKATTVEFDDKED